MHDISPDFLETLCINAGWAYNGLYEELAASNGPPLEYRLEQFARRRSAAIVNAMHRAAIQHGVPFDFMRLECNGQRKLLIKAGRVILLQEPIHTLHDSPHASDYKVELADVNGIVRQMELDLGDRPQRVRDWSGCHLAVLLHGASGPGFSRRQGCSTLTT